MRPIDADALITDIEKRYCKDCERRKGVKGGKVKMLYEIGEAPCRACGTMDAMEEIDNAPTIEAEPVRHGHWKKISPAGIYECSNCKQDVMTADIGVYKYCHRCGAKMDEVSE